VIRVSLPTIRCRLHLAVAMLLVLCCLAGAAAPASARPAAAQPAGQVELADILQALEVDAVAADVLVLLDTSASMQAAGRYASVTAALRPLLDALSPTDRLILFTFDTVPALRYAGAAHGSATAVARLPRQPNGRFTDIGSAIDAGLRELEGPEASPLGAIVLITDGRAHPPDGSIYRDPGGAAWSALRRRTAALAARGHQVNPYALALRADTDAALLKRVFPATTVLALPPDQLEPFMRRLRARLRVDKARELLASDRDAAVQVRWPGHQLEGLDLARGVADVDIELLSTARRLPLELSGITAVSTGGLDLRVGGLPERLLLRPGERRTVRARVSFPTVGEFRVGRRTVERQGSVRLQAEVTTPWAEVAREQLRLDLRPSLQGGTGHVRATGSQGLSHALIALAVGVLVLVLVAARSVAVARRPSLRGTLVARAPGTPPKQVRLAGRKLRIGRRRGSRLEIAGAGTVRARRSCDRRRARRRRRGVELLISYSAGHGRRQQASCPANGSVVVDGTTFSYHAS